MIKAIFFDAAGILYTRSGPTEEFAIKLLKEKGFRTDISNEDMQKQLLLRSQANEGSISHETYWDQWLSLRKVNNPDQRKEIMSDIINFSNAIQPVPGAKEALSHLKQKGIKLGIITDTMYPLATKMKRLEKAGVAEFIDIVACSTELGAHKPDPLVYGYAIQQANLTPAETGFVGHLGIELEGARKAGMTTIAINQDQGAEADYFCESLLGLPDLPIFILS